MRRIGDARTRREESETSSGMAPSLAGAAAAGRRPTEEERWGMRGGEGAWKGWSDGGQEEGTRRRGSAASIGRDFSLLQMRARASAHRLNISPFPSLFVLIHQHNRLRFPIWPLEPERTLGTQTHRPTPLARLLQNMSPPSVPPASQQIRSLMEMEKVD